MLCKGDIVLLSFNELRRWTNLSGLEVLHGEEYTLAIAKLREEDVSFIPSHYVAAKIIDRKVWLKTLIQQPF